jgi:hypothetical protein
LPDLSIEKQESLKTQIERAKTNGRKYWADFEMSKDERDFIFKSFLLDDGYIVSSKVCPRGLWEVYITFFDASNRKNRQ